jgi:adenylate cyclase
MPMLQRRFHVGFRTSMIALFFGIVLFVGLSLVYLSFARVTTITRSAAASFLDTVAHLSADRIDAQLKTVRDTLDVLQGVTWVQSADIRNNPQLHILMASLLRNNKQLYNIYVGYDDGSFLEMDDIDRAGPAGRVRLGAPDGAKYRLVIIAKPGDGQGAGPPRSTISPNGWCRWRRCRDRPTTIRATGPGTRMPMSPMPAC